MLCSQKYDLKLGLQQLREVWTKNFKTFPTEENDVEMTGDGEGLGEPSPDEDDFEKQMHLANESDKTVVRTSPSQTQDDQLEGWLLEKPIPLSRMTTSVRKSSLTIGMENCQVTLM